MAPPELDYRFLNAHDGPAVRRLLSAPDLGRVRVARIFHRDPIAAREVLEPRPGAVCAILEDSMVGLLLIQRARIQWNGQLRKGVFVRNLTIHPEHRRRGISTELQTRALELYAQDVDRAVVYGSFQVSNQASLDMVRANLHHRTPSVFGGILPHLRLPPRRRDIDVRAAQLADLPAIAQGMNAYYARHQLYPPQTAEGLRAKLKRQMDGCRPHHLYAAVRRGRVVGGFSVRDSLAFSQVQIFGLSWRKRIAGVLSGVHDTRCRVRTVRGHSLWFEPGREEVAETLLDTLRFRWRRTGSIACFVDPRDPAWPLVTERVRGNRSEICYMTNEAPDSQDRPVYRA